ncbi:host attachment family protein [Sphingomonas sp. 1P06PA]|uniref:host attachment family protein n=1 Tax=Sphingomonas sp. 1P06PA TaxID=554121 RepID=UPI0039A62DBA
MNVPHDSHVLVADGRKLLFLRNAGDAAAPNLEVVRKREQDNPPTREQGTDQPGRAFASNGSGRNAYEQTDFHEIEEQRFAAEVADMLKRRALANEFEKLIIIAPPSTLGELRKHYHKEVQARITGELAKDLTGHPIDEIERLLIAAE